MPVVAESEIVVTASTGAHDKAMARVQASSEKTAKMQEAAEKKAQTAIGKEIAKRTADEEKANTQRVKNALRASEIVFQYKQKEVDKIRKLEDAANKARLKAAEKAAADEARVRAKAAEGGTFMGKIKGVQSNPFISQAETIASLGITAGGSISKVSILAASAIRPIAFLGAGISALGPAGLAAAAGIGAIAAPVAGLAIASKVIYALSDSAVEAEQRLREMGLSAEIPEESRAAVVAYKAAQTELSVELDKLAITLGTELIPYAIKLTDATRGLIMVTDEWGGSVVRTGGQIKDMLDTATPVLAWLSPTFSAASTAGGILGAGWDMAGIALDKLADKATNAPNLGESELTPRDIADGRENGAKLDELEGARQQLIANEALRKGKAALAEATREEKTAAAELERELKANAAAGNARTDELNRNYKKWTDDKKAADEEMLRAEETARKARVSAAKQAGEELKQIEQELIDQRKQDIEASIAAVGQIAGAAADVFDMLVERSIEALDRISDRQDELREANANYAQDAKKLANLAAKANDAESKRYYQDQLDQLEQDRETNEIKLQNAEKREDAKHKLLVRAFNANKAASIAETAINGAVALVKAVAQLGPIAGGFAAAGIIAGTGVAIGQIASQKPPEYPIGRPPASSPDHPVRVAIQDEEAILNKQGVKAAGGSSGVNSLNNGTGGDGAQIEVQYVQILRVEKMENVDRGGREKKVKPDSGKKRRNR